MRLLLDTHALLWWLSGDRRLSRKAQALIGDEGNDVYISAASAWEVTTKYRLGKLPEAGVVATEFSRHVARQGFIGLDISLEHGERAGALGGAQRDPFDRMLIAQSQAENLTLVSNEEAFDDYGL